MAGEALCRQARGLGDIDVCGIPPAHLHAEGGVRVFSHSFGCDASDFVQCSSSQDGAGATKEGCVPQVAAILDDAIEQFPFIRVLS